MNAADPSVDGFARRMLRYSVKLDAYHGHLGTSFSNVLRESLSLALWHGDYQEALGSRSGHVKLACHFGFLCRYPRFEVIKDTFEGLTDSHDANCWKLHSFY